MLKAVIDVKSKKIQLLNYLNSWSKSLILRPKQIHELLKSAKCLKQNLDYTTDNQMLQLYISLTKYGTAYNNNSCHFCSKNHHSLIHQPQKEHQKEIRAERAKFNAKQNE